MLALSKLKICYIAGTLGQGGAERQLFYAIQALRQNGVAVRVLSLDSGGFWEGPINQLGATVTHVGQDGSRAKRVCRILKTLKKEPADILQSQHFYTNAYASVSAFFLNCKAIGALRSNGFFDLSQCGNLGGRINLHLPQILAANSQSSIHYAMKRGVPASRLFFLPNVVDTERFKPAAITPQGPITLLAVGRLTREKRFDRFISLVHRLRSSLALDVRGWIVGPTRADQDLRPELERQAASLGLRSNALRFLGRIPEMSSIYQQSTIFVLTSEHEGTPNVLLEAMASGLPVVATRVGGVPEIVQHGCTGFLAAKDEINELTSAILALARNPQLAIEMGARARAYIEQTHSVHQLPAHLADLYDLASGIRQGTQHEPRFSRALANDAV
jgi:glycosyltransferase involved in cell wall biosynthesis